MQFKKFSYMVCAPMAGNGKYCLWLDKKNQFVFFITTLCITLFLIAGFLINTTPQEIQGQAQYFLKANEALARWPCSGAGTAVQRD